MSIAREDDSSPKSANAYHTRRLRLVGALPLVLTVAVPLCGCGRRDEAKDEARDTGERAARSADEGSRTRPVGPPASRTRPTGPAQELTEALRAALHRLRSADTEERLEAIDELSVNGSAEALRAIAAVTQDQDTLVACRALLAVASSRLENRREHILRAAKDPRPEVRRVAMVGIGRLEDKQKDGEMLAGVVRSRKEYPQVRAAAAQALGLLRAWDQRAALVEALRDSSALVRGRSAAALRRMTGRDFHFRANDPADKREAAVKRIEEMLR